MTELLAAEEKAETVKSLEEQLLALSEHVLLSSSGKERLWLPHDS
jgi:hypothetical protein